MYYNMNDWIVANITNPTFDVEDFQNIADMSLDNTQLLKKEEYLKSDFIKNNDLFKNDKGNFSEDKFNKFYDTALQSFSEFSTKEFPLSMELSMFDTDRTKNSKIKNNQFSIARQVNPDRQKIGIEGINFWSDPEKSKSELAQANKIWDSAKQEYRDYSPNDKALFNGQKDYGLGFLKSLFEEPLVMAQWEEDGEHLDPITNKLTKHRKGDYKLNDEGTYYYETLNGRSPIGKEVLSTLDTITVDGKGINKYDFFDSDDIEKSVTGVIAKNAVALLPMFLGGPIGTVYSTALIARELSKSLPMLYGISTMLSEEQNAPEWLNTIAAVGSKFTSGTSNYAKEHTFSMENFGNLISDVALQWGQQKAIAQTINSLRKSNTYIDDAVKNAHELYKAKAKSFGAQAAADPEQWKYSALGHTCLEKFLPQAQKATKQASELGRDISLAYMSIISNSDVYGDMLQHGASKTEAALVALGSTIGMFAVDKGANLGTVFFDDATEESVKAAHGAIKKEMIEAAESFKMSNLSDSLTPANKMLTILNRAINKSKEWMSKYADDLTYHTTNMYEKMMTEGLEEVSEELITDTAKSIYELAGRLGADTSVLDVGAWDNMLERYTMSMLGGAIGGGIFYGKEVWDGKSFKRDKSNEEIATLIRNGHIGDLRDVLEKMKSKGKLGDTKLSASEYELDKDGKPIWLTTKDKKQSQNEAIANMINDKITAIEAVLKNNQVGLSDDKLFEQMVLSEARFARYQGISSITNYYQDFNNIVNDLIAAELDLKKASNTIDGTVDGDLMTDSSLSQLTPEQQQKRQENIANLEQKVETFREKKNMFLSGDTSLDYARKLNFAMDPILHSEFLTIDREQLWKKTFKDKKPEEITEKDKIEFETKILPEAKTKLLKDQISIAWNRYKDLEKVITPMLASLAENSEQYKEWTKQFESVDKEKLNGNLLRDNLLTVDTKLDIESDEDYNARNSKIIDPTTGGIETDDAFKLRVFKRLSYISKQNDQKSQEWVDSLMQELQKVNGVVDPLTFRAIKRALPLRLKDVINNKINLALLNDTYRNALKNLNADLSNIDDIQQGIQDSIINGTKAKILSQLSDFQEIETVEENSAKEYFIDSSLNQDNDWTIGQILEDPSVLEDDFSEEDIKNICEKLEDISQYVGTDVYIKDMLQQFSVLDLSKIMDSTKTSGLLETIKDPLKNYLSNELNVVHNEVSSVITDIKNNPLFSIQDKIKASVKNPLIELLKQLESKVIDGKELPNIEEILNTIENDFENLEDVDNLRVDPTKQQLIEQTKDALKMINTFLYAASSQSNMFMPIGHNKVFNEFAEHHKDVIANWEPLPEIDADYALIYQTEANNYINYLDYWIDLSTRNAVNKKAKFEKTDRKFSRSLYDALQRNINAKSFIVNIDDKEYDLLKNIDTLDLSNTEESQIPISLYSLERLLYTNFQEALYDSGLSVQDFLEKSKLLENLLYNDPVEKEEDRVKDIQNIYKQIARQKISQIDDTITEQSLTSYDKLQYYAAILTLNPQEFYSKLKAKITKDDKIAPITIQEYASKISLAANNQQFRDIIGYAHKKSGDRKYFAGNTVVVPGVAGAGKTQVIGKSDKDYYNLKDIIALGPTSVQANALQKSLNLTDSQTIDDFLKQILGNEAYADIFKTHTKDYFDYYESDNGFANFVLKDDAKILFNQLDKVPKLLLIDEATHLSSIKAQILDTYMREVGGVLKLLGDPNQRGFYDYSTGMGNVREVDIFAVRTPKLTISLRDNNIQKQSNLENIRTLLDQMYDKVIDLTEEELEKYWPSVKNIMSKFNFKYYNKEVLHGDLITDQLTDDLISKINVKDSTIGFIGDKKSAAYKKLVDAGLGSKVTVLSMDEMQGQEFDYVVIDQNFKLSGSTMQYRNFLQDLYTLMSRGRTASIFIDNNLSNLIGSSIEQNYTASAPSLTDKINGVNAIDTLRQQRLNMLEKLDLSEIKIKGAPEIKEIPKEVTDEDFTDPDQRPQGQETDAIISKILKQEKEQQTESIKEYVSSEFLASSYGDVTFLNVEVTPKVKKVNQKTNQEYEYDLWVNKVPEEGPLRNLQALLSDGVEAYTFRDKKNWAKLMYDVKSALIFNHDYSEQKLGTVLKLLPSEITSNFSEEDWKNGRYELEIREATDQVTPIYAPLKEVGFKHTDGKRYIANIVFKVKNRRGRECVFDLTGINNPSFLKSKLEEIKANIDKKLAKPNISEDTKAKLTNIKNTIDQQADIYADLVDSWIKEFNQNQSFSLDVTSAIRHTKCTWFKKRTGAPIRLGGNINPDTGETSYDSLEVHNPGMNFSDVYTYADNANELESIDKSLKGKAVIFVSSDTLIPKDKLWEVYKNQKKDPEHNTPVVRMLVLNNYGLNLSQLYDEKFIKAFQSGEEKRKPFRQNFLGIQMFTSMWNFRAGLSKFNTALQKWMSKNNYSEDKVTSIIKAQNEIYHKRVNGDINTYLDSLRLTQSDLDKLESFNQQDLKDIPMFRLGQSDNNNEFYLRSFDVRDSIAYAKDRVDLLVITPNKARTFYTLLNDIMRSLVPNAADDYRDTLGLKMLKEDKTPWEEDEFIDLENAKHKRTLSNLLKFDKDTGFSIKFDGKEVAYPEGQEWSAVPGLITSILKTVTWYQYNPDQLSSAGLENATIYLHNKNGEIREDHFFNKQIGHWLTGKDAILKVKENSSESHPDRTLMDMMELIFHGTTEDVHRPYSASNPFHKLEDARFKEGFFINPDIVRKDINFGDSSLGDKVKNIFYPIETDKALFTVDVDLRASGLGLSIETLTKLNKARHSDEKEVVEEPKEQPAEVKKLGISFNDFEKIDLNFEDNYYLVHQTLDLNVESILNTGLRVGSGPSGTTVLANLDTIYDILVQQSEGHGHQLSNGLIIIEVPKSEIQTLRVRQPDDLMDIMKDDPTLIPAKYIKYGIIGTDTNQLLKKNAVAYSLISRLRTRGEDLTYSDIQEAIEIDKKSTIPAVVNNYLTTQNDTLLQNPYIADIDADNNTVLISLQEYFDKLLNKFDDSVTNIYIEDNRIFIEGNEKYVLNTTNYLLEKVDNSEEKEETNFLETSVELFGTKLPLQVAIKSLLDSDEIKQEILNNFNEDEELIDIESINSFSQNLFNIIDHADQYVSEQALKDALANFKKSFNSTNYIYIASYLSDNYSDIYNKLFMDC